MLKNRSKGGYGISLLVEYLVTTKWRFAAKIFTMLKISEDINFDITKIIRRGAKIISTIFGSKWPRPFEFGPKYYLGF